MISCSHYLRAAHGIALVLGTLAAACSEPTVPDTANRKGPSALLDVDPHPENPLGIFIPNVNPSTCFGNLTVVQTDYDGDSLDDTCELELARAFSPVWQFAVFENCQGGEPAFAVAFFPQPGGGVVRIGYMPAYYDDCGSTYGDPHHGDSEFAMVEVVYSADLGHWLFVQMWLSAHYKASYAGVDLDRSRWESDQPPTEFPDHPRGYPRIYVSTSKHANYSNVDFCNNVFWENGCGGGSATRWSLDASRNVWSRVTQPYAPYTWCAESFGQNAGSGRQECFYAPGAQFNGWYAGTGGQTPYRNILVSDKFDWNQGLGQWSTARGPTPSNYAYISGPTLIRPGPPCHYFLTTNMTGSADWYLDGVYLGSGGDIWVSTQQDAWLSARIVVESTEKSLSYAISVSSGAPECGTEG
jgi:hypothetical protein